MKLIPVNVECCSGYKADEYPKCFYHGDKRYEVTEIDDRWYQSEYNNAGPASNYFRVTLKTGEKFIIKHDLEADKWFLCQK